MKLPLLDSFSNRSPPERYDRICIVQVGDRHTELLGYFLEYFAASEIDFVHRFHSQYSYIDFFERSLGKRFARVLREYDRKARYDLVVFLTSGEAPMFRVTLRKRFKRVLASIGLLEPCMRLWMHLKERRAQRREPQMPTSGDAAISAVEAPIIRTARRPLFRNSRQTVAICHIRQHATSECRNFALTPLVRQLPWLLPVMTGLPTISADARNATICCMGLLEERYYQIIPELARALPDKTFRLFVRQIDPICAALLAPHPNVVVSVGEGTDSMMECVASSLYLLILDHDDCRYRHDRLSGAIPFGLNLTVPMVMSNELAAVYDIRAGIVGYRATPDVALAQRLASITPAEYRRLVDAMVVERARLAHVAATRFDRFLHGEDAGSAQSSDAIAAE